MVKHYHCDFCGKEMITNDEVIEAEEAIRIDKDCYDACKGCIEKVRTLLKK